MFFLIHSIHSLMMTISATLTPPPHTSPPVGDEEDITKPPSIESSTQLTTTEESVCSMFENVDAFSTPISIERKRSTDDGHKASQTQSVSMASKEVQIDANIIGSTKCVHSEYSQHIEVKTSILNIFHQFYNCTCYSSGKRFKNIKYNFLLQDNS